MKALLFLIALFTLASSQVIDFKIESGCTIPEGETKCCWLNSNGCCQPPKRRQMCTMALKTCCKTKVFDEETQSFKYVYN